MATLTIPPTRDAILDALRTGNTVTVEPVAATLVLTRKLEVHHQEDFRFNGNGMRVRGAAFEWEHLRGCEVRNFSLGYPMLGSGQHDCFTFKNSDECTIQNLTLHDAIDECFSARGNRRCRFHRLLIGHTRSDWRNFAAGVFEGKGVLVDTSASGPADECVFSQCWITRCYQRSPSISGPGAGGGRSRVDVRNCVIWGWGSGIYGTRYREGAGGNVEFCEYIPAGGAAHKAVVGQDAPDRIYVAGNIGVTDSIGVPSWPALFPFAVGTPSDLRAFLAPLVGNVLGRTEYDLVLLGGADHPGVGNDPAPAPAPIPPLPPPAPEHCLVLWDSHADERVVLRVTHKLGMAALDDLWDAREEASIAERDARLVLADKATRTTIKAAYRSLLGALKADRKSAAGALTAAQKAELAAVRARQAVEVSAAGCPVAPSGGSVTPTPPPASPPSAPPMSPPSPTPTTAWEGWVALGRHYAQIQVEGEIVAPVTRTVTATVAGIALRAKLKRLETRSDGMALYRVQARNDRVPARMEWPAEMSVSLDGETWRLAVPVTFAVKA